MRVLWVLTAVVIGSCGSAGSGETSRAHDGVEGTTTTTTTTGGDATSSTEPLALPAPSLVLPFVSAVAPDASPEVASLELASEDEELTFELAPPEGEVDDIVEGIREVFRGMTGEAGTLRPIAIDGREGKLLSVVGDDRGQRVALGFAIVDTADGRQARFSYQIRGLDDAAAALEHVTGSLARARPAAASSGYRVVGVAGWFFEAPVRALVTQATLAYPDDAELSLRIEPRPTSAEDDPLTRATASTSANASDRTGTRRVTDVTRAPTTVAGVAGTRVRYRVHTGDDAPAIDERAVEVEIAPGLLLFVRGTALPRAIDFDAFLDSVRITERAPT